MTAMPVESLYGCARIRLHHRRRRIGRLRGRKPAVRRSVLPRAAAGSRRIRPEFLAEAAGRLLSDDLQRALFPPVQDRAERGHRRPLDRLAARPRARRIVVDQRPDLHSRPARGFRRLGTAWRQGLELSRTAAVFPPLRTLSAAARASITAASASSRCPIFAPATAPPRHGWRPAWNSGCRAIRISTARPRWASAPISSASDGTGAPARRRHSCVRSRIART